MTENHTIAAIATPPGEGGIAVVRLSGPASYAVALDTGRFLLVSGTDCYICTDT